MFGGWTASLRKAAALQRTLVERQAIIGDVLLLLGIPGRDSGRQRRRRAGYTLATPGLASRASKSRDRPRRRRDASQARRIVGYPIIDLKPDRCDVHRYVRDLGGADWRRCRLRHRRDADSGLTGVWAGADKLAAIGVRISLDYQPRLCPQRHQRPGRFPADRSVGSPSRRHVIRAARPRSKRSDVEMRSWRASAKCSRAGSSRRPPRAGGGGSH